MANMVPKCLIKIFGGICKNSKSWPFSFSNRRDMNIQKSKIATIAEPAKQNQLILVSKLVLDRFGGNKLKSQI